MPADKRLNRSVPISYLSKDVLDNLFGEDSAFKEEVDKKFKEILDMINSGGGGSDGGYTNAQIDAKLLELKEMIEKNTYSSSEIDTLLAELAKKAKITAELIDDDDDSIVIGNKTLNSNLD